MKIEINGSIYEGDYVTIVDQMKRDNVLDEKISTYEYVNEVQYLMLRFFDKDIDTEATDLEGRCENLVKELLRKGLAKRLD